MAEGVRRPAFVEVDLDAIRHNVSVLRRIAAPAQVCAVVKADAYGHGAVPVAWAALAGGAQSLAVALVDEGVELRAAGIDAPILLLSEPDGIAMDEAIGRRLTPTLYSSDGVARAREAVRTSDAAMPYPVELKVDTGMHRVGADPPNAVSLARTIAESDELYFSALWTHFAVADEPDNSFTADQLARFGAVRAAISAAGIPEPARVHAANSAGTIAWRDSRLDMVRCGIALYGYAPSTDVSPLLAAEYERVGAAPLIPALSWKAKVSFVRQLEAGERVSYGRAAPLRSAGLVATVPLGYADGIPRSYFTAGSAGVDGAAGAAVADGGTDERIGQCVPGGPPGEVLIHGARRALAGNVTMDQILVDCGEDDSVRPGDEVVLIGHQGNASLTADDWADRLGTLSYEVITRIGLRVPRLYLNRSGPFPTP